ncbi:Flp pilus assembly complex ATPase component TadA [bacterium]|nr:Flp pilus assembly complex ATPase component TadA [FCB group bacterium]MBL7192225.1 Flp pilus assembly complex ATPase component TadA [bacterium]
MNKKTKFKDKLAVELIRTGLVDPNKVAMAIEIRENENSQRKALGERRAQRNLAQILVQDFRIDHYLVFNVIASLYGFREITLADEDYSESRIEYIRKMFDPLPRALQEYMIRNKIIVLRYDKDRPYRINIAAADPTDRTIPDITRALGVQSYEVFYVKLKSLSALMEKVFPPENVFLKEIEKQEFEFSYEDMEDEIDETSIEAEINKSLLVNLAEGMLIEAVRRGASDIHIIPAGSNRTEINIRIDGTLRSWHIQEGVRPEAIAAVIKDRSKNVDRFERDSAQDGFIQRKIDDHMIRYRVSVIPIQGSEVQNKFESIVIRILDDRKVISDLDKLGFQGIAKEFFIKAISKPQGMIIVTGPTGSGKSTTLIAALSYIMRPEINVLTVEDPVEYIIRGARQLKISYKMDFEQALRAVLRHDPDVVMVGEIRDKETAETAIKMANTGHLTFSTLHTNDAPSAVSRLYKMGIETFLIAYAINIIIAQRLVRRLCDKCKRPMKDKDSKLLKSLGFTEAELDNLIVYEPVGCGACHGGYKGRLAIHETLYFSKQIRRLIFEASKDINEEAIKEQAVKEGMITLRDACRERMKQGLTSIEELIHVTSED